MQRPWAGPSSWRSCRPEEFACALLLCNGMPVIGPRTDFRLCADSDGGLVNAMIQGSVLSMCRSADEVLGVLGRLR